MFEMKNLFYFKSYLIRNTFIEFHVLKDHESNDL